MFTLKQFYQYKRELKKNNTTFQTKLLPNTLSNSVSLNQPILSKSCQAILYLKSSRSNTIVCLTNLKGKV